jgi:hypothetical protein
MKKRFSRVGQEQSLIGWTKTPMAGQSFFDILGSSVMIYRNATSHFFFHCIHQSDMDPNEPLFLGDDKVNGFCHELVGVVGHGNEDDG